jgi:hypothetical protein
MRTTYEKIINVVFFLLIYFILFAILREVLKGTNYSNSASIISAATGFFSRKIYRKWTTAILDKLNK